MSKKTTTLGIFSSLFILSSCAQAPAVIDEPTLATAYSPTHTVTQTDNYFGTQVPDPYRWLEQISSPEVQQWVVNQNEFAKPFLEALPLRDTIKARLTALWNYERLSTPFRQGERYFYYRNDGLQNQSVLYVTDNPKLTGEILIDPNTFSADGTVSLARTYVSPQGNYVAYGISDGGSDWTSFKVRHIATGEDLADAIEFTKFTNISWLPDESGFYYSRYPANAAGQGNDQEPVAIYFHLLGNKQSQDQLIYEIKANRSHNPYAQVSRDGRFIVASISEGFFANAIHVKERNSSGPWLKLFNDWTSRNDFIDTDGNLFFFMTNDGAETGRVIAIDYNKPQPEHWQEIIAPREETLTDVSYVGGKFFATYLRDARSVVRVHDAFGRFQQELNLNSIGTVSGFSGNAEHLETFFSMTSFTEPNTIYRYDIRHNQITELSRSKIAADLSQYVTEQVFYSSKDGTKIPMFLVHKKGLERNGKAPVLLYGYGGFNISLTPSFSSSRIAWLELGGVLAIPNLRGGGEYGAAWHRAGTGVNKQNVFDDFIAAAEWLIHEKITSPEHLGIQGGSNGGLLVGAVITQRPELFAAALPAVGVLDMLRYHLPSANARAWSSDFGLSENEAEFNALYAYSPVHNTKAGACYPATLITTGDHDDRVVPWHSYKFAAVLERDQGCDNPVLLRVETRAGHGAGTPIWMRIEQIADDWAFLAKYLNAPGQPK
ncbi:prolyl oligopeptidase family serine peptidase [Aliidiomarina quisquiliarum]|uniref:prolyl oligopeptidase family serine peptidase n=1 Tax=Aliidiomarina quisquiliarum TaxID=2938947 RepID=UPI00208E5CA4|nr:prolyl oligopeptidase family serine peptidase [Aliidiomarina quisquiliarum]MCO4321958.1 prolyl oligopeptidase family serine peptidase [Aliidiomarina quisquiliarum]